MRTAFVTLLALVALPHVARGDTIPIDIQDRGANRIVPDGVLGDWRRFTELTALDDAAQIVSGRNHWTGPDDASVGFALARDDQLLYFAAEVHDDVVVRSREHRTDDDALLLSFAAPNGPNRTIGWDIAVYPGDPGNYRGAVRWRGSRSGEVPGAQVVEAPLRGGSGFTIEVTIPWRAMPELQSGIGSARARLAYHDSDTATHPTIDTVLASGPGDGEHVAQMPPLAGSNANGTADQIALFQRQHEGIGDPFLDRSVNIAGDAALERVLIYPGYVVAAGPGIAGGARYAYIEIPSRSRDDLLDPAIRDVTGDGRQDILVRVRLPPNNGLVREVLYVYGAPNGSDQLSQIFAIELARTMGANRVANRATYENGGIRVTYDGNVGFTQQNYPHVTENGVVPPLTPWSDNRMVAYHWNDSTQRFDVARTEPNQSAANANTTAAAETPASPTMVQAPDANAVLVSFRHQNGIADDARANFTVSGNFAGDRVPETVQIFGRHLVVTGAHYMNGRSFYSIELPVSADADVLALTAGDVTADGRLDAIVRVRRDRQAQVRGRTLEAQAEYVMIYSLDDAHRGRVFAAEVGRRVGTDGIRNVVHDPPSTTNGDLTIDAGQVIGGWNAHTYPFHDLPMQGFAPLLLPWDNPHRAVYHWDGSGLVLQH
jgi:hypothetical protein